MLVVLSDLSCVYTAMFSVENVFVIIFIGCSLLTLSMFSPVHTKMIFIDLKMATRHVQTAGKENNSLNGVTTTLNCFCKRSTTIATAACWIKWSEWHREFTKRVLFSMASAYKYQMA